MGVVKRTEKNYKCKALSRINAMDTIEVFLIIATISIIISINNIIITIIIT